MRQKTLLVTVFFSLGVVLYFARALWLPLPAQLLYRDDPLPKKADAVIILLGDSFYRPLKSAEIYKRGIVDRIFFGSTRVTPLIAMGVIDSEADIIHKILRRAGIPENALTKIVYPQVTSTVDEARIMREALSNLKNGHAIVVTSWFHTGRAAWIFERAFGKTKTKISVVAAPTGVVHADNWWTYESGVLSVFTEYLKWVYYLIKYSFREV